MGVCWCPRELISLSGLFNLGFLFGTKPLPGTICSFSGTVSSLGGRRVIQCVGEAQEDLRNGLERFGPVPDGFWHCLASAFPIIEIGPEIVEIDPEISLVVPELPSVHYVGQHINRPPGLLKEKTVR